MRIVVLGGKGLLGSAIASELTARGHLVVATARSGAQVDLDLRFDGHVDTLRAVVRGADIVVNAIGILIERDGNTWDAVHREATQALFAACEAKRVARIVHISALGVGTGIPGRYMASKLTAEHALSQQCVDYAIVRPGLLVDDACPSTRLFWLLSGLPVIGLPGLWHPGVSQVAPIQVSDVARCVGRIVEHPKALRRVIELTGPEIMSYREMLSRYRADQGKGAALWLPVPWWLIKLAALAAVHLPQKVFSINTMRMLQAGSVAERSETRRWLRHEPTPMLPARARADGHEAAAC
jgi:uncharacterized protein YbjT (DUF2867 family)